MTSPLRDGSAAGASADIEAIYPLTALQHGMLVHALADAESRVYVEQLAVTFDGPVDAARLERAWDTVTRRHAALRTSFVWKRADRPMQVVHASVVVSLERVLLPQSSAVSSGRADVAEDGRAGAQGGDEVLALLRGERAAGLDLAKAPLFRLLLASESAGRRHVLVWTHHHALLDGWSVATVLAEVLASYAAPSGTGTPAQLPPARPFKDYVTWLGRQASASLASAHWRDRLRGITSATSLLAALGPSRALAPSPRPEGGSTLPTQRALSLSRETTALLAAVARRDQVTLATIVQAAWAILLARLAGDDDVLFGVTMSGRPPDLEGVEHMVGLFINTLPMRVTIDRSEAVAALLQRVQREAAAMRSFEWSSLVEAQAASEVKAGRPLFEGVVVVENFPAEALGEHAPPGLAIGAVRVVEETNYPWMLVVGPGERLSLRLDADPTLIDDGAAEAVVRHLGALLESIAQAPALAATSSLVMTPRADADRLDGAWNATAAPGLDEHTVIELVLRQATAHPARVAVEASDGTRTYAELARRAQSIASELKARGVNPSDRVGVALRRGALLVEVLLAIGMCGAAYVAIDVAQPAARTSGMLGDAAVHHVVTERALEEVVRRFEAAGRAVVVIDGSDAGRGSTSITTVSEATAADLAYVLFTSGSTGRPKGVAVRHGSVANLLASVARAIDLQPDDRWLAVTPLTFDIAGLELFGPLVAGATVVIATDDEVTDGARLLERITQARPSILQATPSTFRMCMAAGELALAATRVLVGGEPLNRELARDLVRAARAVWNVYGPTETTIWSTLLRVDAAEAEGAGYVAIGRPLANTRAYVLDAHGGRVGAGIVGDLVLAGAGLAEGYVGDELRTRASFRASPWGRLYATGDRGYFRDDGALAFVGRADGQIKLRGHRIELGEIESHLEAHADVAQAVVTLSPDGDHLVAHVVGSTTAVAPIDLAGLRGWLAARLPAVFVPTWIVTHPDLPRTPNGKVDRKLLAASTTPARSSLDAAPLHARTAVEDIVLGVLAEVLKAPAVGLDDDFFELGGHSLMATQVAARLRRGLGVELPLRALFEGGTARAIVAVVEKARGVERVVRSPLVPIAPRDSDSSAAASGVPLSFAQARLWFIDQLEPERAFYNVPALVRLRGALDVASLEAAFSALVQRHTTLRSTFHGVGGVPEQRVSPPRPVSLQVIDLASAFPGEGEREAEARRLARAEVQRPFDLRTDLLLRVALLRLGPLDHVVVVTMHHIASDGWSIGVLIDELVALYGARGDTSVLPSLAVSYTDFAVWQRRVLEESGARTRELERWKQELSGLPLLEVPTDYLRPAVQRFRGRRHAFVVEAGLARELRLLARKSSATLFMTLLAGFSALLSRLARQDDIAVGTPVANRVEPELERLIGFFANTLVLRVDTSGDPKFTELVARVREKALAAYDHQDLPFEQLVDALSPARDRSRAPLFQVMFVLQNAPRQVLAADGLAFEPVDADLETSKVDLELTMMETSGEITGSLEYDLDLFAPETIARWAEALVDLLRAAVVSPDERLSRLSARREVDLACVLDWAGPRRAYATEESVLVAIERRTSSTPSAVAVVDEGGSYTYAELDEASNRVAHALIARAVERGDCVGVAVLRSKELLAAILGVLKAGAAYVPLEPDAPFARRVAMADDASVAVVLSESAELPAWQARGLDLRAVVVVGDGSPPRVRVEGHDLAYVLFTSGSTGRPKGVMVEHRSVINRIEWQQDELRLASDEAVLHKTPYGFDVSVWELLWALREGARIVVVRPEGHKDPSHLVDVIRRHAVTTVHFVPSMLSVFLEAEGLDALTSLRRVLASGEALTVSHVARFRARLPWVELHNLYGPTEAAIDVTHWRASALPAEVLQVPIGRAIANTRAYVVGRHGELLPGGALGELWVAGIQVARGYVGDSKRTEERFVPDPIVPGERAYRTGDLARFAVDGTLEFRGRIDHQVKLRGHRIELGEIESTLRAHEDVADAAVVVRASDAQGVAHEPRLVAFVVPRDEARRGNPFGVLAHVGAWREVFDATYGDVQAEGEGADPSTDLRGWTSSFDERPIPESEMLEWVAATVAGINEHCPRRVLEVGCGTGLLLFRIAPEVERYVGVDVAAKTLARVAAHARALKLGHVALHQRAAHDLGSLAGELFDTIVINSVVQYFPDGDYLTSVLESCAALLPRGGVVFVGDVRSLPLARALATAVEIAHAPDGVKARTLAQAAVARVRDDEELLVDPRFFFRIADPAASDAAAFASRVTEVVAGPKRGPAVNELTAYRYDVSIRLRPVGETRASEGAGASEGLRACEGVATSEAPTRTYDEIGGSLAALEAALLAAPDSAVVVDAIPNARLARDLRALALVDSPDSEARTAGDVRTLRARATAPGEERDALLALAARLGRRARVSWDLAHVERGAVRLEVGPAGKLPPAETWASIETPAAQLVSRPREAVLRRTLPVRLREHLQKTLPDVMVPTRLVLLDAMPIGATGKADRGALLDDAVEGALIARRERVAPRTELEAVVAAAFSAVLGIERVSATDHFFELGGHSLLATRLVSRLSASVSRAVTLRTVFDHPTVEALARALVLSDASGPLANAPIAHGSAPVAPLTFAQRRLHFLESLGPGSAAYVVPATLRIEGHLDAGKLGAALDAVTVRHRVLRSRIEIAADGEPMQRVATSGVLDLPVTDLREASSAERHHRISLLTSEMARTPFDLAQGPLFRARLIQVAEREHLLLLAAHHLAVDRWSLEVLVREVGTHYAEGALPPLAFDYFDFARWQRSADVARSIDDGVVKIRARLEGAPALLALPLDRPRVSPRSADGARIDFSVPREVAAPLEAFARASRTTPFAVYLAALAVVLGRYGAGDDVVLGTALAGRTRADLEPLIGMFVNTVPLRLRMPEDVTFAALVAVAREEALEAFAQGHVPFEALTATTTTRSLLFEPIVQAMLVLQNAPSAPLALTDTRISLLDADTGTAKLDLTLFLEASPGSAAWAGTVEYRTDLFDRETIAHLAGAFVTFLEGAVARPDDPVAAIPLLGKAERARLLALGRGREAPLATLRVDALVRARAHARHQELVASAHRLAGVLALLGAKPGARVVLAVERVDALVGILGALEAGAAWVPVEPSSPPDRARLVMDDCKPVVVVTRGPLRHASPAGAVVLDLDSVERAARADSHARGDSEASSTTIAVDARSDRDEHVASSDRVAADEDAAYVLYTSGSTGVPKGVVVPHRALANHMAWMERAFPIATDDVVLLRTPLGFDASVWEVFLPLLTGAAVVPAEEGEHADPVALEETIRRHGVTVLQLVPTLLDAFVTSGGLARCGSLRYLFAGGEALTPALRARVQSASNAVLVNLYGPTETTIDATFHVCARASDEGRAGVESERPERALASATADGEATTGQRAVPIGQAIDNLRVYVLDASFAVLPRGASGELFVAGAGVASGYLGRDDLTAARFLADPFVPGGRMYRTGDRARFRADGALEFLGRLDDQVKLGGTRLELAEIEAALRSLPWVVEAAAAVVGAAASARLVGFVVLEEGRTLDAGPQLRAALGRRLPPAGIPSSVVAVAALPRLEGSGKLDRARLAKLEAANDTQPRAEPIARASGAVEEELVRVFRDVLRVAEVSVTDDFFALGGDSILSLQIVARARALGIVVATRDIFEARTIRALAATARSSPGGRSRARSFDLDDLPLLPAQSLFFDLGLEDPHHFAQAALVVVPPDFDGEALERGFAAVLANHEALRLAFGSTARGPSQRVLPVAHAPALAKRATSVFALSATSDAEVPGAVARLSEEVARTLAPESGRVVAVAHLDFGAHRPGRVLVVAHHLVVDTVSWSVLEDDLVAAYAQARDGAPIRLGAPSASLVDCLASLEGDGAPSGPHGVAPPAFGVPLPRARTGVTPTEASARTVDVALTPEETRIVLRELRARYDAPLDALLLGPFLVALAEWTSAREFVIAVESHGRDRSPELDLSRVIGWFTSIRALRFSLPVAAHQPPREAVAAAARTLTAGPDVSLSAGAGRVLPEIGWNFLGRVGSAAAGGAFARASEPLGALRSPRATRLFLLEVVSSVDRGVLGFSFVYSEGVHARAEVERLAATTLGALRELLRGDDLVGVAGPDAADAGLDARELARVMKRLGKKR